MRPLTLDPTAGKRARAIRVHPEVPQPVSDPTDARYGRLMRVTRGRTGEQRNWDPTDPEYGEPAE